MDTDTDAEVLYYEEGASWLWLLAGPLAAAGAYWMQSRGEMNSRILLPLVFFLLVTGFIALQVKAARVHVSVELTPTTLREGTEVLPISDIVSIYPELEEDSEDEDGTSPPRWTSARSLGELSNIPRGRKVIGLRLTDRRNARAWAKRPAELREALAKVLDSRMPPDPTV